MIRPGSTLVDVRHPRPGGSWIGERGAVEYWKRLSVIAGLLLDQGFELGNLLLQVDQLVNKSLKAPASFREVLQVVLAYFVFPVCERGVRLD